MRVELALGDAPDADEANAAAVRAFATYEAIFIGMGPRIRMEFAVRSGSAAPFDGHDGKNTVRWITSGWDDDFDPDALAVTVTSYDGGSGRIGDADIALNAERYVWSTAHDPLTCRGRYDVEDVLAHEVGHLFGLGHDAKNPEATMYPSADACEIKKRDLSEADMAGLRYLYVEVGPAEGGCAVGGRGNGMGAAWVVALLAFAVRRRMVAAWVSLLAVAAPAEATIIRRLGLEKMGQDAGLVVQGIVRATNVVQRGARLYTDAVIDIDDCVKGPCPEMVTVRQLGAELDGVGLAVDGAARFAPGTEVVVFLRARRDGTYAPVGMAQGAYVVERDPVTHAVSRLRRDLGQLELDGRGDASLAIESIAVETLRRAMPR